MATYVQFNRKLDDFLDDMSVSHPHVKEFSLLQKSSVLVVQMDPTQPLSFFSRFVVQPYGAAIKRRDEAFLLSEKYAEPSTTNKSDVVSLLKGVWRDMDHDNQDAVWRHLQTLVILAEVGSQKIQSPH